MRFSTDTIVAIATAPGPAAIAMLRLSGPDSIRVARAVLGGINGRPLPAFRPRHAHLCSLLDNDGGAADDAIVCWFPAPHSYTGEDVVELSVHGGPMPCRVALEQCLRNGARLAEPGEFTLRAFLAGRLDLSQAEAVIDAVSAQTRAGLRLAHRQLSGRLSSRVHAIRAAAMKSLALIEAAVDFPDDVVEPDRPRLARELDAAAADADALAAEAHAGRLYRDGIRLVILGRPNVGKSSLLNALLREERAIVTPVPGTTRDLIEERLSLGGVPVQAVDTAGLRDTEDIVEKIGVSRARAAAAAADVLVVVLDRSEPLQEEDDEVLRAAAGRPAVLAANKSDLRAAWPAELAALDRGAGAFSSQAPAVVAISAVQGEGIAALEQAILEAAFEGEVIPADRVDTASERHSAALRAASADLREAARTAISPAPLDLISVDLRGALQSLGEITGETAPEDLLHEIFTRFCIGK